MTDLLLQAARIADLMLWVGAVLALSMAAAVVAERVWFAHRLTQGLRVDRRYEPIVKRAIHER